MNEEEINRIVEQMKLLTEAERWEIIHSFCVHCGNVNMDCNCWKDE